MTKISLIHPSRSRPEKAFDTYSEWLKRCSSEHEIQHVLSLDLDDPKLHDYKKLFGSYIEYPNQNVVQAANAAAKYAQGEILLYLSDDFKCPENWDKLIVEAFGERVNEPCLLKVHDDLQEFKKDVVTIPITTKALYDRLSYFFHPAYASMFCDQDIFWVCRNNGWLIERPDLVFEHHHYSNGKSQKDETYTRSDKNWNQGLEVYNKRKKLNFPI